MADTPQPQAITYAALAAIAQRVPATTEPDAVIEAATEPLIEPIPEELTPAERQDLIDALTRRGVDGDPPPSY